MSIRSIFTKACYVAKKTALHFGHRSDDIPDSMTVLMMPMLQELEGKYVSFDKAASKLKSLIVNFALENKLSFDDSLEKFNMFQWARDQKKLISAQNKSKPAPETAEIS